MSTQSSSIATPTVGPIYEESSIISAIPQVSLANGDIFTAMEDVQDDIPAPTSSIKQINLHGTASSTHADPEANLHSIVNHYQSKYNALIAHYQEVLTSTGPDLLKTLLSDIQNTKAVLQQFHTLLDDERSTSGTGSVVQAVHSASKVSPRISYRDIPVFQVHGSQVWRPKQEVFDSIEHFLHTFQKVLKAMDVDLDQDWEKWLDVAIHHDYNPWFELNLANHNYTWKQAHKIFQQWFESPDRMIAMATEAYTMLICKNETVMDYGTRF
ncbi:hypothetical protein EC973_008601 [Apophysomyces ossiformis]|uniref:Retrotransposon gag domain-containing protein n=1 Tax=Apophysomyces ossiformis TaxID=679940 RepID=A0A8H7BII6_9FUNG|nr:hypothetical protein EC973_008601 [Apophysomyces ossiformis]